MEQDENGPAEWKVLGSNQILQLPHILTIDQERWRQVRSGREGNFYRYHLPNWVQVVAVEDGGSRLILVNQYRFGLRSIALETPGGNVEPNESPLAAARRELLEETGHRAERWQLLAALHPMPAYSDNFLHIFLATGCRRIADQHLDFFEEITVTAMAVDEVYAKLSDGTLNQAHVVIALLLAREHLQIGPKK
ncbi:MAG: NUDIX hydrolase [Puniceicoccales bacterium]|jgi:8-oxo-dGTP pyrophosphatase MutT (NUDIX family)|nr:NUDIX hydrolase [Puniceicoccales bacterium]